MKLKLNFKAPKELRAIIDQEIQISHNKFEHGQLKTSWHHLERAHILSQSFALEHTHIHWLMLQQAIKNQDTKEIRGQIIRLLAGGFLSLIKKIPKGNTGGADISATKSLEIPPDLQSILERYVP